MLSCHKCLRNKKRTKKNAENWMLCKNNVVCNVVLKYEISILMYVITVPLKNLM